MNKRICLFCEYGAITRNVKSACVRHMLDNQRAGSNLRVMKNKLNYIRKRPLYSMYVYYPPGTVILDMQFSMGYRNGGEKKTASTISVQFILFIIQYSCTE